MSGNDCDILVIGGGINGCGIARDAAGRGFDVVLAEQADLASGTSSASTKLIHGGLRYLEYYEFRLVREALTEREILWRMAPHIVWPLRFVLPHHGALRPAWLLRLGLFIYDHIGGRKLLPPTRVLDLRQDEAGKPLRNGFVRAFEYSDAWVQDARLVALNARDASNRGARIHTRTRVTGIRREGGRFRVDLRDGTTGADRNLSAAMVINAAGPWVEGVRRLLDGATGAPHVRLVQGSHIVVPKLFDHDRCYIFQNADGRIVFAIPYESDFTLIGTTDRDYAGNPAAVRITPEETAYLCEAVSGYFRKAVTPADVVWTYAGVRPLYDDHASSAQAATRDYVLEQEGDSTSGVAIHVYGGKITTYRRLAEAAMDKVEAVLGKRAPAWTAASALPGGNFPVDGLPALMKTLKARAPAVAETTLKRLARHYGMLALPIVASGSLGRIIGADLGENEVRHLVENEWALTAEDVLWRRTKLGLRFTAQETAALEDFLRTAGGATSNA
ncbi:glycerol-3-phosphate dehydrogenase [Pseudochelatococcus lubricantis]|uniref:Glycerol-3-phosphate dehydrogenase n=1 Tax=Pseudochelatococcus lubricantis TaxID=1538102 RepID=A0ABX0UZ10_9HYPH|nr:glycerol-3-phosphate dehydrogenase [Pseudochelatococcus lubricantis]NIJ57972.1 glycerol-3-phosphate dehydrogenase [Pseudochelatococcus lubricantis]